MIMLELSSEEISDLRDCVNDRIEHLDQLLREDTGEVPEDAHYYSDTIADLQRLDRMLAAALR